MPPGDGSAEDDYPRLVQNAVASYVRGQLLFSLVMGGSAALLVTIFGLVGLFPAGTSYSWFFGVFYGLMEFVPYIGPIIGPIPALLVALFEHPISAVWLLIAFVGLQQLEGHVVAPQLFRLLAADQPDPDHHRAAGRRQALRDRGRARRAAGDRGPPGHDHLPPSPHRARAVGRPAARRPAAAPAPHPPPEPGPADP